MTTTTPQQVKSAKDWLTAHFEDVRHRREFIAQDETQEMPSTLVFNIRGHAFVADVEARSPDRPRHAKLVAEELERKAATSSKNGVFRDFPNHGFTVAPVQTFKAQSETRVRGIVEDLLRSHFQR